MRSFETHLRELAQLDPGMRLVYSSHRYEFEEGILILRFSGANLEHLEDRVAALLCHNPLPIISKTASPVCITLETGQPKNVRISAKLSPSECLAILRGEPPNERNVGNIIKYIQEKAAHPMTADGPASQDGTGTETGSLVRSSPPA